MDKDKLKDQVEKDRIHWLIVLEHQRQDFEDMVLDPNGEDETFEYNPEDWASDEQEARWQDKQE